MRRKLVKCTSDGVSGGVSGGVRKSREKMTVWEVKHVQWSGEGGTWGVKETVKDGALFVVNGRE